MTNIAKMISVILIAIILIFATWFTLSFINVIAFNLTPDPMAHIPAWNLFRVLVGM